MDHMAKRSRLDMVEADLSELEDDLTDLEGRVMNVEEVVNMVRRMPRHDIPVIEMQKRRETWQHE